MKIQTSAIACGVIATVFLGAIGPAEAIGRHEKNALAVVGGVFLADRLLGGGLTSGGRPCCSEPYYAPRPQHHYRQPVYYQQPVYQPVYEVQPVVAPPPPVALPSSSVVCQRVQLVERGRAREVLLCPER